MNMKKTISKAMVGLLVLSSSFQAIAPISSLASGVEQQVITFSESETSNQSKTITIPKLDTVTNVTSDHGNVSYTQNGENVTITVSSTTPSRQEWNTTKYSKTGVGSQTSSTNSFPSSLPYSDGDGYSGTLMKNGSSTVISGMYTPSDSKTATSSQSNYTNSFPSTVSYNSGGYSGTLSKNGASTSVVESGTYTPADTKYVTAQTSPNYNSGGYTGTLSSYVYSGSYTPGDSFTANDSLTSSSSTGFPSNIDYHDSEYDGTLWLSGSPFVISGSPADSKFVSGIGSTSQGKVEVYCYNSGSWNYSSSRTVAPWIVQNYNYNSGGYTGTLNAVYTSRSSETLYSLPSNPTNGTCRDYRAYTNYYSYQGTVSKPDTRVWQQYYSGTVTKPAVDTRVYRYQGNVTKPASDTRVWLYTQNYSGTVTKPASDTRTWEQDYSGNVYKGGYDDFYSYNVTISYATDTTPPNPASLTADKTIPTNGNVVVSASYPSDALVKQIKVNNGAWTTYNGSITMTDNGYVEARSLDKVGNVSTITRYDVNNIDRVAPSSSTISSNPTTPTNQDVTISISYPSDAVTKQYRIGTGSWTSYTSPFTVSSNVVIESRSYDQAGNISIVTQYSVTNIDKVAPTTPSISADVTKPTNQNVTVTVTFPGDVVKKEIRVNNGAWVLYTSPIVINENGKIEAKGTDNANNTSAISSYQVSNIDRVAPQNPSHSAKTNENKITLMSDNNSTIFYQLDNGSWTKYTETISTSDGTHELKIKAVDEAGNESEAVTISEFMYRDALQEAKNKVSFAENNITQENVDMAYEKVDTLPHSSSEYQPLMDRLDDLQIVLDAQEAINKATETRNEADIQDAKDKIDLLDSSNPIIIDLIDEIEAEFEVADILTFVAKERYDILSSKYGMSKVAYNSLVQTYYAIKYTGDTMYEMAEDKVALVSTDDKYYELAHEQYELLNVDYDQFVEDRIATDAEIKAESSVKVMESNYDPSYAVNTQSLINAVEDATIRASLQKRLDDAKGKYETSQLAKADHDAIASVVKAETTKQTYYVSEAYKKVNTLTNETLKKELTSRLQALEVQMTLDRKISDATRTVELAEQYKYDSYITSAQTKVSALPDGEVKTSLQSRLDALKSGMATSEQATIIKQATNYVSLAYSLKTQYYVDKTQGYVNQILDPVKKAELQAKLDAIVIK